MSNLFQSDYIWIYDYRSGEIERFDQNKLPPWDDKQSIIYPHESAMMERIRHLEIKVARLELASQNQGDKT